MEFVTEDGQVEISGELLGSVSSARPRHSHDTPPGQFDPSQLRCSACRWTRLTLLRDGDRYHLVTEGVSIVPGEQLKFGVETTTSPLWISERLHRLDYATRVKYLPRMALKLLHEAAERDDGFRVLMTDAAQSPA